MDHDLDGDKGIVCWLGFFFPHYVMRGGVYYGIG
jgi:hypothetical protein